MSAFKVESPDGVKAVELRYQGEVHFGPAYFSCAPIGFDAPIGEMMVGQDVHWDSGSKKFFMLVFHSVISDVKPDTELIRVDSELGTIESIEHNLNGLINMIGYDLGGYYEYEVVSPGGSNIKKRYR